MRSNKTIKNMLWRFAERCGAQGVSFIVSIILARLLAPELYGTIALITVITAILQVFVDSGMGSALIQKKEADDIDFSTVFYFNCVVCILLYIGMFFVAPYIASFYSDISLIPIIRALSVTLIISGVKNVQQAYVSRNMLFKRFFFSTLGGTIGAAAIGITMAYMGFGVWALVAQQLFNTLVDTIILWITVKWRPKRCFSFERLKGLFYFGWKLLVSALIDTTYNNLRQLLIGKLYSPTDLAFYNKGQQFPQLVISNLNASIDSVLFSVMSNVQDERMLIKDMTRKSIKISVYIIAPLMVGLAFIAGPLVELILTDKWIECVPYLRLFCITYMFYPIHTANLNAIKALGRSDLFLKLEIWKKIVGLILLITTMRVSVMAMAYSLLISSVCCQIINSWPNRKLLDYGYYEQLKDILPSICLAVVMGGIVYQVQIFELSNSITLIIQVILGGIVYVLGSIVFKIDSFNYLYHIAQQFFKKS